MIDKYLRQRLNIAIQEVISSKNKPLHVLFPLLTSYPPEVFCISAALPQPNTVHQVQLQGQQHGNLVTGCYHTQLHFEVDHRQTPNPGQELGRVQQLHDEKKNCILQINHKKLHPSSGLADNRTATDQNCLKSC